MQKPFLAHLGLSVLRPLCAVALFLPLMSVAQQAPVSLAGPSSVRIPSKAVFHGAGLAPNSAVSVAVLLPNGVESHYSAVVDAEGKLTYSLAPASAGMHTLKVLDSGGRVIGSTVFHVSQ